MDVSWSQLRTQFFLRGYNRMLSMLSKHTGAILIALALTSSASHAQVLGSKIDYLIGSDTGGGYDRYARLIAKHMEKYLDGTEIVPVNEPAGAGIPALNAMARGPRGRTFHDDLQQRPSPVATERQISS